MLAVLNLIDGNYAAYFDVRTKYFVQDGFFKKNEEAESSLACHPTEKRPYPNLKFRHLPNFCSVDNDVYL